MTTEPHAVDAAAVAATLGVDPAVGLAAAEVERRARESGPNAVEAAEREPVWRMLLEAPPSRSSCSSSAAGVLAILLGEVRDGLLVLVGLVPIVGADVVTEYRGERALEALRDASAPDGPGPAGRGRVDVVRPRRWCRATSCCSRAATSSRPTCG